MSKTLEISENATTEQYHLKKQNTRNSCHHSYLHHEDLANLAHIDIKLKPFTYEWLCEIRATTFVIVFSVSIAVFTDVFVYSIVVPILPYVLETRLGVPTDTIQSNVSSILALYAVGLVVGSVVFGYIADKITHRRLIMLLGLTVLVGSTLILLFAKSLALYMVGRVAQGLSASVVWVVGLAIIADVGDSSNISFLMSFTGIGMSFGMFMGPLIGGVVYDKAGYNAVFYVCFAVLAVDILLRVFMLEKSQINVIRAERALEHAKDYESLDSSLQEYVRRYIPKSDRNMLRDCFNEQPDSLPSLDDNPSTDFKFYITIWKGKHVQVPAFVKLLLNARILAAFYATVVIFWITTAFETILTIYVEEHFHFSALKAGAILLAFAGPSLAEPLIGHLSDKIGPRYIVLGSFLLVTPPLILLRIPSQNTPGHIALMSVLLLLIGVGMCSLYAPVTSEFSIVASRLEQKYPGCLGKGKGFGQVYGIFNVAWSFGSLIGPFAAGGAVSKSGWGAAVLSLGILTFGSALVTFPFIGGNLIVERQRRKQAASKAFEETKSSDAST